MINCVIIDDEPPALEILKNYIHKVPELNLMAAYTDAVKALTEIGRYQVDLVFCDIEMPDINGLQVIENLSRNKETLFVMVSAYEKYAIEGFNLDVFDYLLKPISFSRFLKTIQRTIDHIDSNHNIRYENVPESISVKEESSNFIFVKSNNKLLRINFENILYIESFSDYIKIHIEESSRSIMSLNSLKSMEEILPPNQFKRIHRSYIVALSKIKAIENKKVLIGNTSLPISKSHYNDLYTSFIYNNILK